MRGIDRFVRPLRRIVLAAVLASGVVVSAAPLRAQENAPAASPASSPAAAEQSGTSAAPQSAPSSGLPQQSAPARTMRAYWHVFVAFALAWLLLFAYALSLGRKFARIEREMDALRGGGGAV
jgi:CcmD family protein